MMKVLNILHICKNVIHMFLKYYLVSQVVSELRVVYLIIIIFHCDRSFTFDIVLFIRSN